MSEFINKRLAKVLKENNITQRELAERTGTTECTISRYVSGERVPHANNLCKIAKALNVSTDYLVGLSNEPTHAINKLLKQLDERRMKYYEICCFHQDNGDKELEEMCCEKAKRIEEVMEIIKAGEW